MFRLRFSAFALVILWTGVCAVFAQTPVDATFTYQGLLKQDGGAVNGETDFRFSLWGTEGADPGTQVGPTLLFDGQPGHSDPVGLADGLFTVALDFGDAVFTGEKRWLMIEVRVPHDPTDTGPYTALAPNQQIAATPHALALPGLCTQYPAAAASPNIIGGHADNAVTAGAVGATIGGGGDSVNPNTVTDDYGVVNGGAHNQAGDNVGTAADAPYATVGGGTLNRAVARSATVGGGEDNEAAWRATVGGGVSNSAASDYATVGGGSTNNAGASYTTVGGGASNTAAGAYATVAGGRSNESNNTYATVGGGYDNTASAGYATTSGGQNNTAGGTNATVAGGLGNAATAQYAAAGGGAWNVASGQFATVAGGYVNAASGAQSTVSGGSYNEAPAQYATIGGGGPSDPGDPTTTNNRVFDDYGTIGGGANNRVGSDDADPATAMNATVGGGSTNNAVNTYSTVGGGYGNTASAIRSTVGGGYANTASGSYGAVGGGNFNVASGNYGSTVAGGWHNTASGKAAMVPGGSTNIAEGDYSFAAGQNAWAGHSGAFVWADASDPGNYLETTAENQFLIRAIGGVGIGTNTPAGELDVNGTTITEVLEITGGSDLSERFDITSDAADVRPGAVVCIDPVHPGRLVISVTAYDPTVAGVVSGAGGVNPGMLMGQKGTAADGSHPVALIGRVWVWCDASKDPIEPGDLLTTSDTVGHAMKAADPARAQGAILGKAMTGLACGRGLVLVLVSLQ